MISIFIGAILMGGLFFLFDYTRKKGLLIKKWQWVITVFCFAYTAFVLEMITSFVYEGAFKAATVMGLIFGLIAIIWGVLLGRFVFFNSKLLGGKK